MNQSDFFTFADRTHSTRGHAYKLLPSHCRVDVRKCVFAESLEPWNSLPAELHHFSIACLFSSVLFLVLICLSLLHVVLAFISFSWHVSGRFRSFVCFQNK